MLSTRLNKILEYVNKDDLVADIGTDHGYLLDECIKKGIKFAQGVENKKGPYQRALLTLQPHIDNNLLTLSLSDGLDDLDDRIDTVVIAGMGGELISQIIDANIEKTKRLKKLIIEPNIKIYELRNYLSKNKFERGFLNEKIFNNFDINTFTFSVMPTYYRLWRNKRRNL